MGWQSPINGGQGSWKTRIVLALLAFALLLGIGYYNGRQTHPEIFDTEHVAQPGESTSLRPDAPYSYPQIDMTERLAKEAAEAKKKATEAAKKAKTEQGSQSKESAKPDQGSQSKENAKTDQDSQPKETAKTDQDSQPKETAKTDQDSQPKENAKTDQGSQSKENAKTDQDSQPKASAKPTDANPTATPPALEEAQSVPDMVYDTSWPPPNNRPRTESTFMRRIPTMLFFLAVVCALIWLILRLIAPFSGKLTGNPPKKKQITLVERLSLGPNKGVALVEVAGKRLVLGITDKSITALAELDTTPPETSDEAPPDQADPASPAPPKDLVKEVIAKHLEALPSIKQ